MSMKLSYRDKVIAIVLVCVIIIVAGAVLFIKPKIADLDVAKVNLENVQKEEARVNEKINTLDSLLVTLKDTANEIDTVQQNFYVEADPYEYELLVQEVLSARNIVYTDINVSYAEAGDIGLYTVYPEHVLAYDVKMNADLYNELPQEVYDAYNSIAKDSGSLARIGITTFEITYLTTPSVEETLKCLDDLSLDEKTLIVVGSTSGNPTDPEVIENEQNMLIYIYSIVPMNMEKVQAENGEIDVFE